MAKAIVVNLLAGPGTGKSTTMAEIFSILKWRGINCEMAPEYAKEKVWEESLKVLEDSIYVFGKQLHTIHRLSDQVDVIVTDSPLLLSLIYAKDESEEFRKLVVEVFNRYDNFNIFLRRNKGYNQKGRLQTEDEAQEIDQEIKSMLKEWKISYVEKEAIQGTAKYITETVCSILELRKRV